MLSCLFVVYCLAILLPCDAGHAAVESGPIDAGNEALHDVNNKWRASSLRKKKNEVGQKISWSLRGDKNAKAGEVRAIFKFKQYRTGRVHSSLRITAPREATNVRAHKIECSYPDAADCIQDAVIGKGILIDPSHCTRNTKKGNACNPNDGRERCDIVEEIVCSNTQKGDDIVFGVLRWATVDGKPKNFLLATGKDGKFDAIAADRLPFFEQTKEGVERTEQDYNAIKAEMEDDLHINHGALEKCVAQRFPGDVDCSAAKVAVLAGGAVATACGFVALPIGMAAGAIVGYASHRMVKHMCSQMHFQTIACQCKEAGCAKQQLESLKQQPAKKKSKKFLARMEDYGAYDVYIDDDDDDAEETQLTMEQEWDQMLNEMFLRGYRKGLEQQPRRQKRKSRYSH